MKLDSALTIGFLLNWLIGRSISNFPLIAKVPWFLFALTVSVTIASFVSLSSELDEETWRWRIRLFLRGENKP